MKKKDLLIIDLEKNYNLFEIEKKYVSLNKGEINLKDCKKIYISDNLKKKDYFFKLLINKLKQIITNENNFKFFLAEQEIFNLRNDRYKFIDRIINFLVIKEIIIKKKIKKIKIISDNKNTLQIFDNMNLDIEKKDLSSSNKFVNLLYIKIFKFYVKALIVILYLKLFSSKKKLTQKKNEFYMSIIPNYFNYRNKDFLNKKKNICNFLFTDETHLNLKIQEIIKIINFTKKKNIFNLEQFINIFDIFILFFKSIINLKKTKKISKKPIIINNLNFNLEIKELMLNSFINRSKLEIYEKSIPRFLEELKVKKMNIFMFEYSLGFFLIRKIRNFNKKIKIVGFQHGIFSDNLHWYDLICSLNFKNKYMPDIIHCSNKYSLQDYRLKLQNPKIKYQIDNYYKNEIFNKIKINKKSNNVLVFPGTHDVQDIYFFIRKKVRINKKEIFYFSLHPKNRFLFKDSKTIKKIKNYNKLTFSKIIISQTSSLIYDFLRKNKNFLVLNLDYKKNLLSSRLKNRVKFIKD